MDQSELLRFVVGVLERLRVPYIVTGSIATIHYGRPGAMDTGWRAHRGQAGSSGARV